jgi:hypothetical protein
VWRFNQTYLQDESAQLSRAIVQMVEPASTRVALSVYWAAEMAGQYSGGPDILKSRAPRGFPLPIELP